VMMFDRLVFPVPEVGSFPAGEVYETSTPMEWTRNEPEWKRWEGCGWKPEEQQEWLEILAPVLRKAPWSGEGDVAERYKAAAAEAASRHLPEYAFAATRTVLTQGLPAFVAGVASFGPRYRSFNEFGHEARPDRQSESAKIPGRALTDVIAAEFLVPCPDPRLTTRKLLRETVAFVAGDPDFRDKRSAFHAWQAKFLADGVTDEASVKHAVQEMADRLSDLRKASKRLTVRKVVKNVFRLAPAALGLAAVTLHVDLAVAIAGAFISLGEVAVDERLFKSAEVNAPPHVAFVFDARRRLGWRSAA
jgi:hypothetical protein